MCVCVHAFAHTCLYVSEEETMTLKKKGDILLVLSALEAFQISVGSLTERCPGRVAQKSDVSTCTCLEDEQCLNASSSAD